MRSFLLLYKLYMVSGLTHHSRGKHLAAGFVVFSPEKEILSASKSSVHYTRLVLYLSWLLARSHAPLYAIKLLLSTLYMEMDIPQNRGKHTALYQLKYIRQSIH